MLAKLPLGQGRHDCDLALLNLPLAHSVHVVAFLAANLPAFKHESNEEQIVNTDG